MPRLVAPLALILLGLVATAHATQATQATQPTQPMVDGGPPVDAAEQVEAPKPVERPVKRRAEPPAPIVTPPTPVAPVVPAKATIERETPVRIGDRRIFVVRVGRGSTSVEGRVRLASRALELLADEDKAFDVHVEKKADVAVVYAGTTPVIQLSSDDAVAAGDSTLDVHADAIAAAVRSGLENELRRRHTAHLVFSFSLVVLMGLFVFLVLRGLRRGARRAADLLREKETIPALRIGNVEVLTPATVRLALSTSIGVATPLVQLALVYAWILGALSLFPSTAGLVGKVSGYVLVPLGTFMARTGSALPVLVLLLLAAFALVMVLRFVGVFFDSVHKGEIELHWLPVTAARPVSIVLRIGLVAMSLLAVAPLLSGSDHGALPTIGMVLVASLGLASTPVLANFSAGVGALFLRRLPVGDFVEIGVHSGRIREVTLFELRLEDKAGNELRVPHLYLLIHPARHLGDAPASRYEVTVDPKAPQGKVRKTLGDAVRRQGHTVFVELVEIDAEKARYVVSGAALPGEDDFASALADALTREGLAFGRIRKLDT